MTVEERRTPADVTDDDALANDDKPDVIDISAVVAYVRGPTGLQILIDQLDPQVVRMLPQ